MEMQEVEDMRKRLERLERHLRIIVAGSVSGILLAVVLGMAVQRATAQPSVLRVRSVEVVDGAGRVRITLRVFPDGGPGLLFSDTQGRSRVVLGSEPGASLVLGDGTGMTDIMLSVFPDGRPELFLRDAMHNAWITLGVSRSSNGPSLLLQDGAGQTLFRAP